MGKMGRPLKEIDPELVRKLAMIHCTNQEIAHIVGCSADTLVDRFSEVIEKGKSDGKMSLRRKQYEIAMQGDRTMLVWLGKQILDQSERRDAFLPKDDADVSVSDESTENLLRVVRGGR